MFLSNCSIFTKKAEMACKPAGPFTTKLITLQFLVYVSLLNISHNISDNGRNI